jgi:hypothetical protein
MARTQRSKPVKIAFDVGGVLSKYPELYRELVEGLVLAGIEVFVITDMHEKDKVVELLRMNDFIGPRGFVPKNVYCANYDEHGEGCKAVLLDELQIDMFYDDFIGYAVVSGCPIRCLVMPDADKPYYADSWKMPDGPTFGRRTFTKRQAKGRDV